MDFFPFLIVKKRLESIFIRVFLHNLNVIFKNSSHSRADISNLVFLIIFQFYTQFLHILTIQFQK
jgi:hypothetical protein